MSESDDQKQAQTGYQVLSEERVWSRRLFEVCVILILVMLVALIAGAIPYIWLSR